MDDIRKVGTLGEGADCVSLIADKEHLGCARDVQNHHRLEILRIS